MFSFYLGLDLGQANDYTALAVLEEAIYYPPQGWVSGTVLSEMQRREYRQFGMRWCNQIAQPPPLFLRSLTRYALRTSYPDIVADIIRRLGGEDAYRPDAVLIPDGTGVGRAVVDMFRYARLPCEMYPVTITGGTKVNGQHIPKRDLIGAVQVLLHQNRLKVAKASAETEAWSKEMQSYRIKLTETGHDTYDPRADSQHDDLVLAVALASWARGNWNPGY